MSAISSNQETVQTTDHATTDGALSVTHRLRQLWPLVIIALASVVIYGRAVFNPPLLDEQYLLAWLKDQTEPGSFQRFITWSGLNPADLTGVVGNLYLEVSHCFAFGQLFLMRFHCLLVHTAAAVCLGLIAIRLTRQTALSLVTALIFLASPLAWQAVLWLGGTGALTSTFCLLACLLTYLIGRNGTRWPFLAASAVLYLGALLSSANTWYGALVIILCELSAVPLQSEVADGKKTRVSGQDLTTAMMGPLLILILTAAYFASTGLVEAMVAMGRSPEPSLTALCVAWKKTLMPVNEQLFLTGGAKRYLWIIVFTAPAALGALVLLIRRSRLLTLLLFSMLWLLCTWIPALGHLPDNKSIFGDAAFYACTAPLALLLALCFSGFSSLATICFAGKKSLTVGNVSVPVVWFDHAMIAVATLLLLSTYCRLVFKEQDFLRSAARDVSQLQKDGKQLSATTSAPYVVITTMPSPVALSPIYNTSGVALFDGATMMMSSPAVPGGRLKDAYRQGQFANASGRWQAALRKVFGVDLSDSKNAWGQTRNAVDLGNLAMPNILHNPLAKLDETEGTITLRSQPPAGPILNLNGMGLSPLEGDFMYLDARITNLTPGEPANIDFYWQTHEMDFYDARLRKLAVKVDAQSTDFHRYYIPLRTIGWTTNGPLLKLTFGFPPGSTVAIKEMGVIDSHGLLPKLSFVSPPANEATRFANGFYKFPTSPELGLCAVPLSKGKVTLTYDASTVHDASGVTFEVSLPDRPFGTANSSSLSGVTWKCFPVDGAQGQFDLPIGDIPAPGLVYVRAVAMNSKHDFIGFFSDDLCLNISR